MEAPVHELTCCMIGPVRTSLTMNRNTHVAQLPAIEWISPRIATVRGQRVIVDADLAALYGVATKRFNEAVKRNLAKFPADFMFVMTAEEFLALRS